LGLFPFNATCSGQRNAVWNSKSTTLRGILWYRTRSSSWNRNVPPAVCRFWCAQLKSWSNTKGCTQRDVGWQTPLHNVPYRRREGRKQPRPEAGLWTPHKPARSSAESGRSRLRWLTGSWPAVMLIRQSGIQVWARSAQSWSGRPQNSSSTPHPAVCKKLGNVLVQ
jgi:hypothetical protein